MFRIGRAIASKRWGARCVHALKKRKRLELLRRIPIKFNSQVKAFVTGIAEFEGGPVGDMEMGGCMDLNPPSPKFKPHADIRRFNVLVHISEFGIADGRDNLAADTCAVTDTPTHLLHRSLKALFTISSSSKLMMQDTIGHRLAR
jgi:hypothetical protein